jgi:hypothetical protein
MEETNYDRKHESQSLAHGAIHGATPVVEDEKTPSQPDSKKTDAEIVRPVVSVDYESGEVQWLRKTYRDKLSLKDKKRPNRLINIMIAPFKGFTYPAVVYAGSVSEENLIESRQWR